MPDSLSTSLQHTIACLQKGAGQRIRTDIDAIEAAMLNEPQADCPVTHRFGPGIYIRELRMRAGTLAIGHWQRYAQMNVFLQGRVTIINDDGTTSELVAPLTFVGPAGRKIGYVTEDIVWQNVYATEETDIATLEQMFLDKSDVWKDQTVQKRIGMTDFHANDRADYEAALQQFGFTDAVARSQSENLADQIPFPHGAYGVMVLPSPIQGSGLFATKPYQPGDVIAPARIGGKRTPAGRYTNHAASPNAVMQFDDSGDVFLVAASDIAGCVGGQPGEEITIDYRQALRLQIKEK